MILAELVFSLPFVFLLSTLLGSLLYGIGYIIAPKRKKARRSQRESYSCGEHLLSRKFQVKNERFFIYAILFMIFDVSAFFLAFSSKAGALNPLIFCAMLVLSIFTLHVIRGREKSE